MATVQQLEKFYQIQRIFSVEDTLETAVANERISIIIEKTENLIRKRAFLRDERRRLRIFVDEIENMKKLLTVMRRSDFLPAIPGPDESRVKINIGGLMFECTEAVLLRDPASMLSQLCSKDPPVERSEEGFFFFDRDWWLFRHILAFLRDGTLPEDRQLLSQLYREATFWRLRSLQQAIEENKLHLRPKEEVKDSDKLWWRKTPSWWMAIQEQEEKKKKADAEAAAKTVDWWKDTKYGGKTYLPLPKEDDKSKDKVNLSATWTVPIVKPKDKS